jgi:hypothetical protein
VVIDRDDLGVVGQHTDSLLHETGTRALTPAVN